VVRVDRLLNIHKVVWRPSPAIARDGGVSSRDVLGEERDDLSLSVATRGIVNDRFVENLRWNLILKNSKTGKYPGEVTGTFLTTVTSGFCATLHTRARAKICTPAVGKSNTV